MSPPNDVENADPRLNSAEYVSTDERAPLLQPAPGDVVEPSVEQEPRTWDWYAWRAFWGVLGIFVLAIFIKGWVDAKDVEVRILMLSMNG
jgi:hypothetical protein